MVSGLGRGDKQMRPVLDRRAQRLLRRLPVTTFYSIAELALLALLALQAARLVYAVVTPVGPVGDWRATPAAAPASPSVLRIFDPFFRLSDSGAPAVVTALDLKLFGIRSDQASGRGSAIIGLPDGTQASYAVGDEILPGVTLKAVAFDVVTIDRGGAKEQIFLDQSAPAATVSPQSGAQADPGAVAVPPPPLAAAVPSELAQQIQMIPRTDRGSITGVTLQPRGSGEAFRSAGLQPGDVLVAINGTRIASADAARTIERQLSQATSATVEVERNGRTVMLVIGDDR